MRKVKKSRNHIASIPTKKNHKICISDKEEKGENNKIKVQAAEAEKKLAEIANIKSIELKDFINLVPTRKDLFFNVNIYGTSEESDLLESFCESKAKKRRISEAWSHILDSILDTMNESKQAGFLTNKTLNYLIDNKIQLISLGHFKLSDEWLLKVYEKDNECIEALQTIEMRKADKK